MQVKFTGEFTFDIDLSEFSMDAEDFHLLSAFAKTEILMSRKRHWKVFDIYDVGEIDMRVRDDESTTRK